MTGGDVGAFRSRSSLPSQLHSTIDSCLKALRTATKAFAALETTLAEERQILERLYYKGKNQHRSALFWRRVGDMRRVLKKMDGSSKFRISNTLERVRGSFHESGGAELSNKAQKRQAWSRVPHAKLVVSALHNLRETSKLLIKAESAFMSAYCSFELLVQSAAFLPLALTLVAIASRAHMLTSDIGNTLEETWPVMRTIATVLECDRHSPKSLHLRFNSSSIQVDCRHTRRTLSKTPVSTPLAHFNTPVGGDEDVGQSLVRIAPTSRGITPPSSSIPTLSPATFSLVRLSPIPADPPGPASSQLDTVPAVGSSVSSSAKCVEEPVIKHNLRMSPMNGHISDLSESVTKQVYAAGPVNPLPTAVLENDGWSSEYGVVAGEVKQTVISRSIGKRLLPKPTKRRTRDNAVAPFAPPAKLSKGTESGEERPAKVPLEAQAPSATAKAKTKTKTKCQRIDEIDAIFDGL